MSSHQAPGVLFKTCHPMEQRSDMPAFGGLEDVTPHLERDGHIFTGFYHDGYRKKSAQGLSVPRPGP